MNNDDTIPLGILLIWDFDKDLNSKEFFSFSSFLFVSFREHDDDTMMVCDFNKDLNLMKSPNSGDFSLPLWGITTMILRFSREKVVRKFYRNLYESFRYAIFNIPFNRPKLWNLEIKRNVGNFVRLLFSLLISFDVWRGSIHSLFHLFRLHCCVEASTGLSFL